MNIMAKCKVCGEVLSLEQDREHLERHHPKADEWPLDEVDEFFEIRLLTGSSGEWNEGGITIVKARR